MCAKWKIIVKKKNYLLDTKNKFICIQKREILYTVNNRRNIEIEEENKTQLFFLCNYLVSFFWVRHIWDCSQNRITQL